MDTQFIDSFVLVAECGSFAEAARKSALTAPALAQRMRALEVVFGTPLFMRSGRTVGLTDAGKRLLLQAYAFQGAVRDLHAALNEDGFGRILRLGTIFTGLSGLMPRMLAALRRRHPNVEVRIDLGVSRHLYDQVLRDEMDVAITIKPPFELPKSMIWRALRLEKLIVLAPQQWAKESPQILLRTRPLIRYERRNWGGAYADTLLRHYGIDVDGCFELDSLEGIAILVGEGLGVSLVPKWERVGGMPEGVAELPIACQGFERPVGLLFRQGHAVGERLMEYMRAPETDF